MEGSRRRSSFRTAAIRRTRKRPISHRRLCRKNHQKWKSSSTYLLKKKKVSEKLEALKNLIPSTKENKENGNLKSDDLFKETANYIVLLKTQVTILQELIGFHGASCCQEQVQENQHVS